MSQGAQRLIDDLDETWRSIDDLCRDLTEAEWKTPTGCPGWSVQDTMSHLIDYESGALGRPRPAHTPGDVSHTKNAMGEGNEVGVDYRRAWPGVQVLDEFREVTGARLAQLRAMTDDDFAQEVATPVGPGTVTDMLVLRVMDTWTHEQDMRRALATPGHERGRAVDDSIEYFARFLPMLIGKRAQAPDGTTVVVAVGDRYRTTIAVAGGRANVVDDEPAAPTVTLTMSPATFAALVGGRADAPDDATLAGDDALGRRILASLAFMP